jgi:hypothetical protein
MSHFNLAGATRTQQRCLSLIVSLVDVNGIFVNKDLYRKQSPTARRHMQDSISTPIDLEVWNTVERAKLF